MSRPKRLSSFITSVTLALGLLVGSCGVPTDDEARIVPGAQEELKQRGNTTEVANVGAFIVTLYFVDDDDSLYALQRNFPEAPTVNDILNRLAANPEGLDSLVAEDEIDGPSASTPDLITSLIDEMRPRDGGRDNAARQQTVVVSSEAGLREVQPERRTLIFTQIVCTLTQEDFDIDLVSIVEDDGESIEPIFAQDSSGAPQNSASTRSNYSCDEAQTLSEPVSRSNTRTKRSLEHEEAQE